MKPTRSILDPKFRYVASTHTDIRRTWRKFRLLERISNVQSRTVLVGGNGVGA